MHVLYKIMLSYPIADEILVNMMIIIGNGYELVGYSFSRS
jgi:hypothetical protein